MKNNNVFSVLILFIGFLSPIHLNAEIYPNISTNWRTKLYEIWKKYMPNMIQEIGPINVLAITGVGALLSLMYHVQKDRIKELQQKAARNENISTEDEMVIFADYKRQQEEYKQNLRQKRKAQQKLPISRQDPTRE